MKKEKVNIKKIIKAKIEIQQKNVVGKPVLNQNKKEPPQPKVMRPIAAPNGADVSKMSKRDRQFAINNPNVTFFVDRKEQLIKDYRIEYEKLRVNGFERKVDVDYEIIICISSFNRFEKINKLLNMFYEQESKFTYKIILLDDNSTDERYLNLQTIYPELEYHINKTNNGRKLYWYTVTQLWQYAKKYTSNTILMVDDDFIICKNFLNTLVDFYYHIKNENNNVIGIAPHLHSFVLNAQQMDWWFNTFSVDGICLFERDFITSFDYKLEAVTDEELMAESHAHGWSQIQKKIKLENKMVYKTRHSLAFHDGNDESKLGAENQKKSKAYTYYFKAEGFNYLDLIV